MLRENLKVTKFARKFFLSGMAMKRDQPPHHRLGGIPTEAQLQGRDRPNEMTEIGAATKII
jgi:hypothetical protein